MLRRVMMAGTSSATTWNSLVAALPGLWGWWKLDDTPGVGATASDSSGNARHGTYTAAGTRGAALFSGSAYAQTSIGGRISLPNYTPPATPKFTIGAWIKTTTGASEQQIVGSHGAIFQFRKSTANNALEFVTIAPSVTTTTAATAINDGNPHFAVMVFDQTLAAGSGRIKLYLDGVQDGASTTAITISSTSSATAIAARTSANNNGLWAGAMDEVFIVQDALSSTTIADLWAARNT